MDKDNSSGGFNVGGWGVGESNRGKIETTVIEQ